MPQSPASASRAEEIASAYRSGRPLVFLFDYDGTLTPIVPHPSLAVLPAHTRELLAALLRLPDVSVAVVSGRALHDVRGLVELPGAYFAGCGGMEIDLLGTSLTYPDALRFGEVLDRLQNDLAAPLQRFPGAWVERKPAALAIHYRALSPLASVCFSLEVNDVLARFPEIRFRVVSAAIEVTPADGWHKGTAVEAVLGRVRTSAAGAPFPLYFGDAPNDEEGMAAAVAAGGLAVGIGPDAPEIGGHRLPDPGAAFAFLTELYLRLERERGVQPADPAGALPSTTPARATDAEAV